MRGTTVTAASGPWAYPRMANWLNSMQCRSPASLLFSYSIPASAWHTARGTMINVFIFIMVPLAYGGLCCAVSPTSYRGSNEQVAKHAHPLVACWGRTPCPAQHACWWCCTVAPLHTCLAVVCGWLSGRSPGASVESVMAVHVMGIQ